MYIYIYNEKLKNTTLSVGTGS